MNIFRRKPKLRRVDLEAQLQVRHAENGEAVIEILNPAPEGVKLFTVKPGEILFVRLWGDVEV